MKIAVTGAKGFIGRYLLRTLSRQGHEVRALTRSPLFPASEISLPNLSWVQGDLHDAASLATLLQGMDVVCHCAGEYRDKEKFISTNLEGTQKLFAAAKRAGTSRMVHLSSVGVYGNPQHGIFNEEAPLVSMNKYEESKILADKWLLSQDLGAMSLYILRPSIVFGIDMNNNFLRQLVNFVGKGLFFFIGKPGASANYVHVQNVAEAMALLAVHKLPYQQRVYNLSDWTTLENFIGLMAGALKVRPPFFRLPEWMIRLPVILAESIVPFSLPLSDSRIKSLTGRAKFDSNRIMSEAGFTFSTTLDQGISQVIQHWKSDKK